MSHSAIFVSATGTNVGKTFVSRGLARAWRLQGHRVAALKPIETGYENPLASDAHALAQACGQPTLRDAPGFYRDVLPLAPAAVTQIGGTAPPSVPELAKAVREAAADHQRVLVEGAGGLLVPLTQQTDVADLAVALGYPLMLVASNALGVLSHVLTAAESAERRGLQLALLVLVDAEQPDLSARANAVLLRQRLGIPVVEMPRLEDSDDALAGWAGILTPLIPTA